MAAIKNERFDGIRTITYTANDEEPNCIRCDHCCDKYDCCNMCGEKHGWFG